MTPKIPLLQFFARVAGLSGVAIMVFATLGPAFPQVAGAPFPPNHEVDKIFEKWNRQDSPGCALAVSQNGEFVYKRGYGMADLDHKIPIDSDTVFHAASLAKQFTAMSIAMLAAQGKLSLDDEARKFIPEVMPQLPDIPSQPLIRELRHHTSGIRDQWLLATMAGWRMSDDTITRDGVLDLVARMKTLNFKPGTHFSYSNTNYTLAGLIVEKVSGQSLPDFVHEHIFVPLNMKRSTVTATHGEIIENRAYGYRAKDQKFELRMPNYDLTGPTNLLTTVEDLIRWGNNFESKVAEDDAIVKEMMTVDRQSYGLGIYVYSDNGHQIIEHDGRDAGYRSHLLLFPRQGKQLAVALLCNVALPDDSPTFKLVRDVATIYLNGDRLSPPSPAATCDIHATPADPTRYIGRYYSREIDTAYDIGVNAEGLLTITRNKYEPITLAIISPDTFKMKDFSGPVLPCAKVTFFPDAQGKIIGFRMNDINNPLHLVNFQFDKCEDGRCP